MRFDIWKDLSWKNTYIEIFCVFSFFFFCCCQCFVAFGQCMICVWIFAWLYVVHVFLIDRCVLYCQHKCLFYSRNLSSQMTDEQIYTNFKSSLSRTTTNIHSNTMLSKDYPKLQRVRKIIDQVWSWCQSFCFSATTNSV